MDNLVKMIYVDGDPFLTITKLVLFVVILEFSAVICAYLGGIR